MIDAGVCDTVIQSLKVKFFKTVLGTSFYHSIDISTVFNGTNRIIYDESMCFNIFKLIGANIHLNFDDDQSVKDYIIKC